MEFFFFSKTKYVKNKINFVLEIVGIIYGKTDQVSGLMSLTLLSVIP